MHNASARIPKKIISLIFGYLSFLVSFTVFGFLMNLLVFLDEDTRNIISAALSAAVSLVCLYFYATATGDADAETRRYSLSENIVVAAVMFAAAGAILCAVKKFELDTVVFTVTFSILCCAADAAGYLVGNRAYLAAHPQAGSDSLKKPSEQMDGAHSWRDSL